MPKAGRTGQKILKIVHILFSSLWVGGAITLWLMGLLLGPAETGGELYGYALSMKFVDDLAVVPGAIGTLVSGILICCFTAWGFFRHRFVAVKLALTVCCILVGTIVLGPSVNGQPHIVLELSLAALRDPAYLSNRALCLAGGGAQIAVILFMLAISTLKPWKRAPKAHPVAAEPAP